MPTVKMWIFNKTNMWCISTSSNSVLREEQDKYFLLVSGCTTFVKCMFDSEETSQSADYSWKVCCHG